MAGTSFNNNSFYIATITLSNGTYTFPTNARIRFRCDASANNDDVYIDSITWRGSSGARMAGEELRIVAGRTAVEPETSSRDADATGASLEQNFPNPFNPRTTISFRLAKETDVTLDVFDASGKLVATLVDGPKSAGRHSVEFDASSLTSGVYFYRLIAGGVIERNKMVLLK